MCDDGRSSSLLCPAESLSYGKRKRSSQPSRLIHSEFSHLAFRNSGGKRSLERHALKGEAMLGHEREALATKASKGKGRQLSSAFGQQAEDNLSELVRVAEIHLSSQGSRDHTKGISALDQRGASERSLMFRGPSSTSPSSSQAQQRKICSSQTPSCSAVSTCIECPDVPPCSPPCTVGGVAAYDDCCSVPCPVACSPSNSFSRVASCSAPLACCDEELPTLHHDPLAVITCHETDCTGREAPCRDARCSEDATTTADTCVIVCQAGDSVEGDTRAVSSRPISCSSCVDNVDDKSISRQYSSFQELVSARSNMRHKVA
jgi:hypothetical protein